MIILDGTHCYPPGIETICWLDDPKRVPRITKTTPRTRTIRSIVVHTVHGTRCKALAPGGRASESLFDYAHEQATSSRDASWDATVGLDGRVAWSNDPVAAFTWHATQVNPYSIGIELVQEGDGTLYDATIDAAARLITFLCEQLGIQRQTCWEPAGDRPYAGHIERLDPGRDGMDVVGVYGHRNVWIRTKGKLGAARGAGDPGNFIFERLVAEHRFERFVMHGGDPQDLRMWRARQMLVGGLEADGIPGAKTTARLKELGYRNGQWLDAPPIVVP